MISIKLDLCSITDGKGYDIKGTLHMEDGFVMDIGDILLIQKRTNYRIEKGTASIETNIEFKGISFCRDFRFTADEPDKIPDQTIGSMIIKPEEFFFSVQVTAIDRVSCAPLLCEQTDFLEINLMSMRLSSIVHLFTLQIMHDLVKNTVKCAMDTRYQGGASKKSLNFYPKNTLTARLRKGLPYSVSMFDDIGSSWQPIIEPFLNEVIKVIPFPSIEYPVDRMTFRVNRNCVSLNCPDCSINSNNWANPVSWQILID